eukprot:6202_1
MAHQYLISSTETEEGTDELKSFLLSKQQKFKMDATEIITGIYDKLVARGLDKDDLMTSSEVDLRNTLNAIGVTSFYILRLINVVRNTEDSFIFKQSNTFIETPKVSHNEILQSIEAINEDVKELERHCQDAKDITNREFDKIVKKTNEHRNKLLNEIENVKNYKFTMLLQKQDKLKAHAHTTMKYNEPSPERLISTQINVDINVDKVVQQLSKACIANLPYPPCIYIIESIQTTSFTVFLSNYTGQDEAAPFRYKLQYAAFNDQSEIENEMKLDWCSATINIDINNTSPHQALNTEATKYTIHSLQPSTNYIIKAAAENENGWGLPCESLAFRTLDNQINLGDEWDPNTKDDSIHIQSKFTILSVLESANGYTSNRSASLTRTVNEGVHTWKFQGMNGNTDSWFLFGIWRVDDNAQLNTKTFLTDQRKYGHGSNVTSYAYAANSGWKKHDGKTLEYVAVSNQYRLNSRGRRLACGLCVVVEMILDLNNYTLSYKVNGKDHGKAFDVTQGTYRAGVTLSRHRCQCSLLSYSKLK